MPEDKNKLSDSELFRQSIGEIKPLPDSNRIKPTQKAQPKAYSYSKQLTMAEMLATPEDDFNLVEGSESVNFARANTDKNLLKRLKKGQLEIQDALDLHGLTSSKALQALALFLVEQEHFQHSAALIIHGKGLGANNKHPVLKNAIVQALRNHPIVLAYVSAQPKDGGTGALYVLFK